MTSRPEPGPTPLSLRLYAAATALAEPFAPALLRRRAARGKEDPARLGERLGRPALARPDGALVWLHGASVGESLSLLPLVEALRAARPGLGVLVTSGTATSAALMAQRLPDAVIHQYAPVDGPRAVGRFLDHWRPSLGVFVESELWPNLLVAAKARGARLALLSAKLSDKSFEGWRRWPGAARRLWGGFDLLLAQDQRSFERLTALGAAPAGIADLKFGAAPLPADAARLAALQAAIGKRPVILGASTHPGEDELVLEAFELASAERPVRNPLLVIVPRHPERGPAVAALAEARGHASLRQSAGETLEPSTGVYVADALGELGLWYRLADLAFIGGSLVPRVGGHNPLEPARLGRPFVSGPQVDNWQAAYDGLVEARGAVITASPTPLSQAIGRALDGDADLMMMAARAQLFTAERDEAARALPAQILALVP